MDFAFWLVDIYFDADAGDFFILADRPRSGYANPNSLLFCLLSDDVDCRGAAAEHRWDRYFGGRVGAFIRSFCRGLQRLGNGAGIVPTIGVDYRLAARNGCSFDGGTP